MKENISFFEKYSNLCDVIVNEKKYEIGKGEKNDSTAMEFIAKKGAM